MKDQQIINYLQEHDAMFLDEVTHYTGQVRPNLTLRTSHGEPVDLPENTHINHVLTVLDRNNKLVEIGLTPIASDNLDCLSNKLDDPNLRNFEISQLCSELADLSAQCTRRKIEYEPTSEETDR